MKEFKLQRLLYKELLKSKPNVSAGMKQVIDAACQATRDQCWTKGLETDWSAGLHAWVAWFDALLDAHPIPRGTELLWFEAPDASNEAMTSVSAYAKLESKSDGYGLERARQWPVDDAGCTLEAGLHPLNQLEQFRIANGIDDDDLDDSGQYAIDFCYPLLLLLNGLPRTKLLSKIDAPDIAVILGWAGGGEEVVGQLGGNGWGAIRRVRAGRAHEPNPVYITPGSMFFSFKKYQKTGRSLEARDDDGATVIMKMHYSPSADVRLAIAAGARLDVRNSRGQTVLHTFGAVETPILRELVEAGADPVAIDNEGWSVLDHVIGDGRCTGAHLQYLWERGARPRLFAAGGHSPIHVLAGMGLPDAATRRRRIGTLKFWLSKGYSINASDHEGIVPLWQALRFHLSALKKHFSLHSDYPKVANILLQHGADPNARYAGPPDEFIPAGATPLMIDRYDDAGLVRALLRAGADPTMRCAAGKTALDYARIAATTPYDLGHKGASAVVKVLRVAVAKWEAAHGKST